MNGQLPFDGSKTLVIGYGNTLRSDDGVGRHVALAVSSWGLPGLESIAVYAAREATTYDSTTSPRS